MEKLHIGEVISYLRKKHNLTQQQLADKICSREYLCKLEKGAFFPTIYTIDLLSKKLNENIYEFYQEIERHNDMETHLKIQQINELISTGGDNDLEIRKLIEEYENLPTFKTGESLQFIYYSKAICSYYLDKNYTEAIDFSYKGLCVYKKDFKLENWTEYIYTNVELTLINLIASSYCRCDDSDTGLSMYYEMLKYLEKYLSRPLYDLHSTGHFYINLYTNVAYNTSNNLFSKSEYVEALKIVDNAINISIRTKYMNVYPSLLKNKFMILYMLQDYENSKKYYNKALIYFEDMLSNDDLKELINMAKEKCPNLFL
ncbi:MAG TPA: hypothetical protein DC000_02105 [Clostridiales bacterium]|nr:hypothetical protein [Clostridiales bacterium]